MYYRRKVLLALLEAFDGHLSDGDAQGLLFQFCQTTGQNVYDFFPYRAGPCSFVSHYDRQRLAELGLLKPADDFQLSTAHSYLGELEPSDQAALRALKQSGLRGEALLQKIYTENPRFTAHSEGLERLFDARQIEGFKAAWNTDESPVVFTLGYEGMSVDAFLDKLIAHNIKALVDIRSNPHSMKYGFSKKTLGDYVGQAGMAYVHLPELGVPASLRQGLGTTLSHEQLFRKYATDLLPEREEARGQLLEWIAAYPRIALFCFEADYHFCHRHTLVEYLQKEGTLAKPVRHI